MAKLEKELFRKGLLIGVGLAAYAQDKTDKLVKELVRKNKISKKEGKNLVRQVYTEANSSKKKISMLVEKELKKIFKVGIKKKPVKNTVAKKKIKKKVAKLKVTKRKAVKKK